jgi:hypothetical protein
LGALHAIDVAATGEVGTRLRLYAAIISYCPQQCNPALNLERGMDYENPVDFDAWIARAKTFGLKISAIEGGSKNPCQFALNPNNYQQSYGFWDHTAGAGYIETAKAERDRAQFRELPPLNPPHPRLELSPIPRRKTWRQPKRRERPGESHD